MGDCFKQLNRHLDRSEVENLISLSWKPKEPAASIIVAVEVEGAGHGNQFREAEELEIGFENSSCRSQRRAADPNSANPIHLSLSELAIKFLFGRSSDIERSPCRRRIHATRAGDRALSLPATGNDRATHRGLAAERERRHQPESLMDVKLTTAKNLLTEQLLQQSEMRRIRRISGLDFEICFVCPCRHPLEKSATGIRRR